VQEKRSIMHYNLFTFQIYKASLEGETDSFNDTSKIWRKVAVFIA